MKITMKIILTLAVTGYIVLLMAVVVQAQTLEARRGALYDAADRDPHGFVDAVQATIMQLPQQYRQPFLTELEIQVGADNKGDLTEVDAGKVGGIEGVLESLRLPTATVSSITAQVVAAVEATYEGSGEGEGEVEGES